MCTKKYLFKTLGLLIAVAIMLALLPGAVLADPATREVGEGKTYATIQAAIAAAQDGDTILVYPGTYEEAIELNKPNITVKSTDGAATTIVDVPAGNERGVHAPQNMGVVTIDGFTVTNFEEEGIAQGMGDREGTTFHVLNNKIIPKNDYLRNGIQVTGDGSTVIGNFVEGAYLTEDWAATAIGVVNASNVLVQGNEISGAVHGIDLGILVYTWDDNESIENVHILDNLLYNVDYPLGVETYSGTIDGVTFQYNQVEGYAVAFSLQVFDSDPYNGVSINNVNASPNWWGSSAGPAEGSIVGEVNYNPWCYVADCTELYVAEGGSIQAAIDAAPEGGKVHVGPGTYEEALLLNKKDITVQSTDGADVTIIDVPYGPNSAGVTFVENMGTVTFDGFTVKNWEMIGITQSWTQREGTTPRVLNNKVFGKGHPVHGNCIQVTGDNALVKGNFATGAHYTGAEGYAATGILAYLANNAVIQDNEVSDSDAGIIASGGSIFGHASTTGVKIIGNTVYDSDECIGVHADAINTVITSNTLHGCEIGIAESFEWGAAGPSNSLANLNKIYDNDIDIGVYADEDSEIPSGHVFNASPNWFGSIFGPAEGKIEGEHVAYTPWCGDAECSFLVPNDDYVYLEGEIKETIKPTAGQTILLADGTVIDANGPCFEVNANNVTIETESPLGAVCYPGSHGVVVGAGVDSFELISLEIDGTDMTAGNGVHFAGAVSNVWLVNNFIHDIQGTPTATGNGVFFTSGLGGFHNFIQGNLFHNNAGNGIEAGAAVIDARYNAWGDVAGATAGDGASTGVNWDNSTHVDLNLKSSGTVYPNQVVKDNQITYTVYGSLANIQGMEFTLTLPEQVSYVANSFSQVLSSGFSNVGASVVDGNLVIYAFQYSETGVTTPVNAEDEALFEFKLSGDAFGKKLAIEYINTNFSFAHKLGHEGPTNNVYPTLLKEIDDLEVIDLPVLSQEGLTDPLTAGIEREFTITLENPEEGGEFEHTLIHILIKDTDLDDIHSFACYDATLGVWHDALLSEDGAGNLVGTWGPPGGFELTAPYKATTQCKVTFNESGEYAVEITLVDIDKDWELARLDRTVVVNAGDFSVIGTVSMQGRTLRYGVLMTLTSEIFGATEKESGPTITNNLLFEGLNGGDYLITTLQERYLNIHEGLLKKIYLDDDYKLPLLHLFGGNAFWIYFDEDEQVWVYDNVIDISDAGFVGGAYGGTGSTIPTGANNADVNFDGVVNIQDLALVGGNFGLTSETAYQGWTP